MEPQSNINDILNLIDSENNKLTSTIYIPSLAKDVSVKTMNTNHSKNIIKTLLDGVFSGVQFNIVMFNIFNEIFDKNEVQLDKINILDKIVIILQLRAKNISDEIEIEFKSDSDKIIKRKVLISNVLNRIKKMNIDFTEELIEDNGFGIKINYPSVSTENKFDEYFYKNKISKLENKDKAELKNLFSSIFINNVCYYVTGIKIGEKEFDLTDKKIDERLAVMEKLPSGLTDKILQKLETKFNNQISKLTSLELTKKDEKTKEDEKYKGEINISPEIFISKN